MYRDTFTGNEYEIIEVPKTAGKPTHIAENLGVRSERENGSRRIDPVVWWNKRRDTMEVVE